MSNDQLTPKQSLWLHVQKYTGYFKAYLHVTPGDEALVLYVTHLKELQRFLLDGVAPHIFGLAGIRCLTVPSPLPQSSDHCASRIVGGGAGKCWSRHGFGEFVAMRVFSSVLHMSWVQLSCGAYKSWRIPGCSTSEPLSSVTDSHLLATTYVISRWNKERDSRRGFLIKSSPMKIVAFCIYVKHISYSKLRLVFYKAFVQAKVIQFITFLKQKGCEQSNVMDLQTAIVDLYVSGNDPSEANVDWQVNSGLKIKFWYTDVSLVFLGILTY